MKEVKLKHISRTISSGLTPNRSNIDFWTTGEIKWLKTEQLGERYIYDTTEKISKKAILNTSIKVYPAKTLSIAMYGEGKTRGNVSILMAEMATNQACCNLVIDESKASYKYVYYNLKTQYLNLRALSSGVRKNLNSNDIKDFKIKIPEHISTQHQIAAVLSALDDKIELNNRINAELEQMANTLYDYWFVQFDFPNADGKPYKSSGGKMVYDEVLKREIPEGWERGSLAKLANLNPTLSIKKNAISPYIEMASVPTSGYMTCEPQQKEFSGGVKFQNGDIVIARITPCLENGKTALITLLDEDSVGFGSTEFINIRARKKEYTSFLAITSRTNVFRIFAISKMIGTSGRKRVDAKEISTFQLAIPSEDLLTKFASIVDVYFEKMTLNTKQNQQLASLRDWLLPMLMNGQVTVGEVQDSSEQNSEEQVDTIGKEVTQMHLFA